MTLLLQDTLVISPATVDKIEQEIEDLRGATDCADVVQDKATLDAYDTSKLTDKAIVKVLQDESRNDAETYYRYSKSSDSFTFIGELGPYYTKSEDDALLAAKQDTLVNQQNIKSVNGNSLLGSGNLELSQYLNFPSSWPTTSATTTKAFCDAVAADTTAIQGKMYLGEVRWSDLPADMVNAEVTVSIMYGSTAQTKVIVLEMTSGNQVPYRWQYTYWNNGSSVSDWIGFVPATSAPNRIYGTSSGGDQSTYSISKTNASINAIVQRDSAGCAYVATPTADGHAATKKYVDDAGALKQNKPTITTISTDTYSVTPADNTIYNATSTLTSLSITVPSSMTVDYTSEINFTSGNTATVVTGSGITWVGDNVNEDTGFQPRTNCRYNIMFTYDGVNFYGLVRGVSL